MRELMPANFLAAILRLGKKCEIDYLYDEGLKRLGLRLDFPNTLEQWNNSSEGFSHIVENGEYHDILLLCYEFSILSCLPTAYLLFVTTYPLASSSSYSTGSFFSGLN